MTTKKTFEEAIKDVRYSFYKLFEPEITNLNKWIKSIKPITRTFVLTLDIVVTRNGVSRKGRKTIIQKADTLADAFAFAHNHLPEGSTAVVLKDSKISTPQNIFVRLYNFIIKNLINE